MALLAAASAVSMGAASGTPLDDYFSGLTTWSAEFRQTAQDANHKKTGAGRGRLVIVRPGKFRWEAAPDGAADGAQLLVADGCNLWFLDRDLDHATVKPLKEQLPQSPGMLLAGGADIQTHFSIKGKPRSDGLDWASATPRDRQSDFREVQFGFKGKELARLVIIDKLGQQSTLEFSGVKRNAPVDPGLVTFTLPAGADLIGEETRCNR